MVSSVTLLFPGQGSQYVGMGCDLESEEVFRRADSVLGYALSDLIKKGPEEELTLTSNAQPAVLAHSFALYSRLAPLLKEKNITIAQVLGHSVGEYAALVAAGVLEFTDALLAVHKRGLYMQEAVPPGHGSMIAVLKVPEETLGKACLEVRRRGGCVSPANYNGPGQIVVSGQTDACDQVVEWLKEHHPRPFRSTRLNVSAPFHSPLMKPAADRLRRHLAKVSFQPNTIAYIANIDAKEYPPGTVGEVIKDNLYKQVYGSVLWLQSFRSLPNGTVCIECGPGKVLAGLAKRINPNIEVISLDGEGMENIL